MGLLPPRGWTRSGQEGHIKEPLINSRDRTASVLFEAEEINPPSYLSLSLPVARVAAAALSGDLPVSLASCAPEWGR